MKQVPGARFQVSGDGEAAKGGRQESEVRMDRVRTLVHEQKEAVSAQPSAFSKTARTDN